MLTIKQTKPWDVKSSFTRIKRMGYAFNTQTLADDIRHNCTNYDQLSKYLQTDDYKSIINATYRVVTNICADTAKPMRQWVINKNSHCSDASVHYELEGNIL